MSVLVVDGASIRIEQRPVVVGLPRSMFVEYFGVVESGAEFVIARPATDWDYNNWLCAMRAPGMPGFVSVEVSKVVRYRDGGTTEVYIEAGRFHFPTPFGPKAIPTFNDAPLTLYESTPIARELM